MRENIDQEEGSTKLTWEQIKALKIDPKPALEDKHVKQLANFSGYERARRRANGVYKGMRKGLKRPARPSGSAPTHGDRIAAELAAASA